MKKYILLSALSFSMLAWSSCQDENESFFHQNSNVNSLTFTASVSTNNSLKKTTMDANGKSILFEQGESMTVIPNVGESFIISNSADDVNTFVGNAGDKAYKDASSFVAMYPSGTFDNGEYIMNIPQNQNVVSGSFDSKANLLIAETNSKDMSLQMHNVCSYIKVNIETEATSIKVCTQTGSLCGKISVSTDGTSRMLEGENVVTLEGNITPGVYYIAVMPGKVSNLMIYTDNDDNPMVEVDEFVFERGKIHNVAIKEKDIQLLSPADIVDYVNASDEQIVTLNMDLETYDHTAVMMVLSKITDKKVKLVIPNGVKTFEFYPPEDERGHHTYPQIFSLVSVKIPMSVTEIGYGAFSSCYYLTDISIPEGVLVIDTHAFLFCQNLSEISIPSTVTSIGEGAFSCCTYLSNVTLPEGIETISEDLFNNCMHLSSITIPNSVIEIGEKAFANCDNLRTIYCSQSIYNKYHETYPQMKVIGSQDEPDVEILGEVIEDVDFKSVSPYYGIWKSELAEDLAYLSVGGFKVSNSQVRENNWDIQYNILDNLYLDVENNSSYKLYVTMYSDGNGEMGYGVGSWNISKNDSFNFKSGLHTYVIELDDIPNYVTDEDFYAHVVFQSGNFVGEYFIENVVLTKVTANSSNQNLEVINKINFTNVSGYYDFWKSDLAEDVVSLSSDGLVVENTQVQENNWDIQYNILDNLYLDVENNSSYKLYVTILADGNGEISYGVGSWSQNESGSFEFTSGLHNYEIELNNIPNYLTDDDFYAHIVFQSGSYVGKYIIKQVILKKCY